MGGDHREQGSKREAVIQVAGKREQEDRRERTEVGWRLWEQGEEEPQAGRRGTRWAFSA